jgi:hypothetical protein
MTVVTLEAYSIDRLRLLSASMARGRLSYLNRLPRQTPSCQQLPRKNVGRELPLVSRGAKAAERRLPTSIATRQFACGLLGSGTRPTTIWMKSAVFPDEFLALSASLSVDLDRLLAVHS